MAIDAVLVGTGTTGGTSVVTAGGTTTTGSTFVVGFSFDPGANISSVTDSKGNTYTQIGTVQTTSSGSRCAMYRSENGTGGASHTATVNFSANAFAVCWLVEVTGAASASFDVTAQANDTSTAFTVTTPTLSQADECVITLVHNDDGTSVVYTSSNTTILGQNNDTTNFWTSAISKLVVSATTAVTPSWTLSAGTNLALIAATFKQAPSAGPTINTQPQNTTVYKGQTANFTVSATTSGGTLHYQWKDDGSNVGTDSNSYTSAATVLADNGAQITCDVSDDNGTTVSSAATLTVIPTGITAWLRG